MTRVEGHAGTAAVAVAAAHGVTTQFTLSGAHVFPMYDAAVNAEPPMRLLDVRHEQTAVFAAEATGKLTRVPGLAVLTAGPGVTNGVSAVAQAHFAGSPLVVIGGRAPANRWGTGSLPEIDHPPIFASITKASSTLHTPESVLPGIDAAFTTARGAHRGPVFLDIPMDAFFAPAAGEVPTPFTTGETDTRHPNEEALQAIGRLIAEAERPVLVLGTDVWADGAERAALEFVERIGIPVITNGMGRGIVPGGHPQLVTKARGLAFNQADLVVVAGTPLDFRLGYGIFGGKDGAPPAAVVHLADAADQISHHAGPVATAAGSLATIFELLGEAWERSAPQT
ncbi:MAG: thiamine pyrophosphate-binding protein, partial [Nocardioides sp.]